MAREYFCAYHSYLDSLRNLTDDECGRLFRALLQYSATGERLEIPEKESIAFDFMSSQIDRDRERYEAKARKNRENIQKRYDRLRSNTTEYDHYQGKGEGEGEGKGEGEGEGEGEGKGEGKTRRNNLSIISSSGAAGAEEIEMLRRLE